MSVLYPPITPDLFGPIVTARDIRQALDSTIQTWSATYIAELAAISNVDLTPFQTWSALYTDRSLPADQTAACWTTCFTTDPKRPPHRQGDGTYMAVWIANANLVISGTTWEEAEDRMALYVAAVRLAVIQHRSLGGFAANTSWVGEATKLRNTSGRRAEVIGVVSFSVTVNQVANDRTGPPLTTTQPGTQGGPTIAITDITLSKSGVD